MGLLTVKDSIQLLCLNTFLFVLCPTLTVIAAVDTATETMKNVGTSLDGSVTAHVM